MYVEQGYRGDLKLWKYLFIPIGFIGFMVLNYITVLMSDEPVDVMMNRLIEMIGKNAVLAINLGILAVGLFVVLGWTKLVHPQSITSLTTSRKNIDWGRIFTSFFIWGAITTAFTLASVYYLAPEDFINNFDIRKFLILLPIAIILVPLQTSFEEYLFRGYMMQGLGIWVKNKWLPLIVTSVLFGLMHIANPEIGKIGYILLIYYIGTGFFLGIITLMDEGLELALGFHAANNLFGVLLVTYDWGALQADAIFKNVAVAEGAVLSEILVPVFVVFPILLFIFSKKYKWTNWNQRLFGKVMDKEEFLALEDGNPPKI
ncbi:CPBP family intramembrane metalloprotease [Croceitalea sp. MTPC9]|uniref:CPBP family intramembrane glutamic endopeptidase n=1 Tax=unclassified Croceitalea TaxID=2632280 RepID=UPI002B3745B0|nr:CPBP family intramembrane metalloprotease [Croceitalea sp. MTPC6]GMN15890.1 CPBP family intramembrane metalloprotease [Croceitalea sp. MTPC9]